MSALFDDEDVPPIFDATSLAFTLFWREPELVRDIDILMSAGHVQRDAISDGHDTPAGWYYRAARSYAPCDDIGKLARMTCVLVAVRLELEEGRPS